MHFILVHGIRNVPWAENPMVPLASALIERGHTYHHVDYGYTLLPITNGRARRRIAEAVEAAPGSIVVAYSNGAYAAALAVERDGARPAGLVTISGALKADWFFPGWLPVLNFANVADRALALAPWWARVANVLPWRWRPRRRHGWGDLGRAGYSGRSERVTDWCLPEYVGHSWFRYPETVRDIAAVIEGWLKSDP